MTQSITGEAINLFNQTYNQSWYLGMPWSNVGTMFETFVNKFFFPKCVETRFIQQALGNRYKWVAIETDNLGQFTEEYVFMDSIPVAMDYSKPVIQALQANYMRAATMLFQRQFFKKLKFSINYLDTGFNFATLRDAISFVGKQIMKSFNNLNVDEELEMKGMIVDYMINQISPSNVRTVTSFADAVSAVELAVLNVQNNSYKYNEVSKMSGGNIGRYTTQTELKDLYILTSDEMKAYILGTQLANTFQVAGLDLTRRIMSFDDLGGLFRVNEDIIIIDPSTITFFESMGDYQLSLGDTIPANSVLKFDPTAYPEFLLPGLVTEIKPSTPYFTAVMDIRCLRYYTNSSYLLNPPLELHEFGQINYNLNFYSEKAISPAYNKILIQ